MRLSVTCSTTQSAGTLDWRHRDEQRMPRYEVINGRWTETGYLDTYVSCFDDDTYVDDVPF